MAGAGTTAIHTLAIILMATVAPTATVTAVFPTRMGMATGYNNGYGNGYGAEYQPNYGQYGNSSQSRVSELQRRLSRAGYYRGSIDESGAANAARNPGVRARPR